MKKLLSILATVGLTATAGTSVVACSNGPKNNPNTHTANVPTEATKIALKDTHQPDAKLADSDQKAVQTTILEKLKDANSDAVINDDTFTINWDGVTPKSPSVKITVKATEPKDDQKGLEAGTIDFKVKFTTPDFGQKDLVQISEEELPITLDESQEGQELTNNDKNTVQTEILKKLKDANSDAVINDDTFSVQLTSITPKNEDVLEIPVTVKGSKGNQEKAGLNPSETKVKVKFTFATVEIIKKLQQIKQDGLTLSGFLTPTDIKQEDVQNRLATELKEFKDDLTFAPKEGFVAISKGENQIEKGKAIFTISYKGNELINPETKQNTFEIPFINQESEQVNNVITHLQEGANVNLTDFEISGMGTIKDLLTLIGPYIKDNLIPEKVPTNFDNDENWKQWQESLTTIESLLKQANIGINDPLGFTIDLSTIPGVPDSIKGAIHINTTISDILNAILPDLIHFRNFLVEQQTEENENLLLLLIQYFFKAPENINNDGFQDIDSKVQDVNSKEGKFITFGTNLERFLHDLLEGWQNSNGDWWHAKDANNQEKSPVEIYADIDAGLLKAKWTISYQTSGTLINKKYSILELLPIDNIKAFINQLLNFNFGQPLTLTIVLPKILSFGGETKIPMYGFLTPAIKGGLKNILNTDKDLKGQLDNLTLNWKEGTLKTEILNEDGQWVYAENFENLLVAKDFRVKFISNVIDVEYNGWTFELKDISVTLNLDISSSDIL